MIFFLGAPMSGEVKISNLLRKNGVKHYLKKTPIFDKESVAFYAKELSEGEVIERLIRSRTQVEIELNPHLTLVAKPLQIAFPEAKLYLLVKDGRKCVNEWMKLGLFQNGEKRIFKETHFSEFEKCCFLWNSTYDFVQWQLKNIEIVKSEEVNAKVLGKLVKKPLKEVEALLNVELECEWTQEEEKVFKQICGKKMGEFGYVS